MPQFSVRDFFRFRYSLRFVIVSFVVLSMTFAWVADRARRNRVQRHAVERIWRLGGHVGFEGEKFMIRPVTNAEWEPELTRTWLDDAFSFRTPTYVLFANRAGHPSNVSDEDVEELIDALKALPTVRSVRLDATKLTRDGVLRIRAALPDRRVEDPYLSTRPLARSPLLPQARIQTDPLRNCAADQRGDVY